MRASVCVALLVVVTALGLAEGYSVQLPQYETYGVKGGVQQAKVIDEDAPWKQVEDSSEEDSKEDDPDFVPDYSVVYDDEDDYYDDYDDDSSEEDESFIAPEDTETGALWASPDDPDWTPPPGYHVDDSQEDSHSLEDQQSQEDSHSLEDQQSQEDSHSLEDQQSQEDSHSLEDQQSQEDSHSIEDQQSQESLEKSIPGTRPLPRPETRPYPRPETRPYPRPETRPFPRPESRPFPRPQDPIEAESTNNLLGGDHDYYWQSGGSKGGVQQRVRRSHQGSIQTVQVPGGAYVDQYSGLTGAQQWGPDVGVGVEPVVPPRGTPPDEVGRGVEPAWGGKEEEEENDFSFGDWLERGWGRFTGAVEDLGEHAGDTFRYLGDTVEGAAHDVHQFFHTAYYNIREKLPRLVARIKALIKKFGIVVQEGAKYLVRRLAYATDQVRESEVIEKLQQKLEEGHAEVAAFFQLLGQKVQAWRREHQAENIDVGLMEGGTQQGGQGQGHYEQGQQQNIPDYFQDEEVLTQLNKLVDVGVLNQEDVLVITQEHQNQEEQGQGAIVFPQELW